MLARTAAGVLSNKFDTEVKIKTFYIKQNFGIHAEEVQINDKKHYPMLYVGKLDVRLSLRDIAKELRVKKINIDDVLINLVKYEDEYVMNISELFASNNREEKERKEDKKPIYLDELNLSRGHFVLWNQNKDNPDRPCIDYAHLDIDSIYMSISKLSYKGDTVQGYINNLRGEDKSGFTINKLSTKSKFLVTPHGFDLKELHLSSHATSVNMDLQFLYNGYGNFRKFVDSVMIISNIRPSQLTLSDLCYFSPTMGRMTDTLQIKGLVTGFVRDFTAEDFSFSYKDSTNFIGTIKMKGLPNFFETHIVGNVERMNFTYQDISEFAIPTPSGRIPLPEMLKAISNAKMSGYFYGFHNNFNTKFNLHTNLGNIYFDGALNNDVLIVPKPYYFYNLHANNLNLKEILGLKEDLMLTFESNMSGEGMNKKEANLQVSFDVEKLKFMQNEFKDFSVIGDFKNQSLAISTDVISDLMKLNLDALLDISQSAPSMDIVMNVENANLYKLKLSDKDKAMRLSTNLVANVRGNDIDKTYGDISLYNTTYRDSRGDYHMDSLNVTLIKNHFDSKDISLSCDFFDMDINGIFNFRNIGNTFKNYVLNYFHINKWGNKGVRLQDEKQEFYVNMNFKNTETLSRLLMPNLKVSDNTNFTATFTSGNYQLYSTLESDTIIFNNIVFKDLHVKNKTVRKKTTVNVNLSELVFKESDEKNPIKLGLDNIALLLDAHNDSLFFDLVWDDDSELDVNKGVLGATFLPYKDHGGRLHVRSSDVIINDSLWNISPTCYIDFKKDKITFEEFDIFSKTQSVNVKGRFPKTSSDTLYLRFKDLNISDFDLLTAGKGIDVDGIINGDLQLSGLSDKFTFLSNIDIEDIGLNHHLIGDAFLDASWNPQDTSIFIDTEIIREGSTERIMSFIGNYYTSRENDNIDFSLDLNGVDISFVNSFTKGTLSSLKGYINGDILLTGSLKNMVLTGEADLYDGGCKIDYLNTYYNVNPKNYRHNEVKPYIKFSENRIDFDDIVLVDTLNNYAVAHGVITHDYLRNFSFDVDATLDNFLAMNMLQEDGSTFYGTAVASGDMKINGPLEDIVMDINAVSMPGTVIDILLTSTSSINDNFIIFVQKNTEQDTVKTVLPVKNKDKKFTFNLNADVSQTAKVNIHLPSNMGNISANGVGNIRLGVASNQLSLYGDYLINQGIFNFNFQNLVRRNFDIRQGGTITWTGKAGEADINITGSYRTKSSISTLGVEIDSTSLVNNVNVDCILHLQEKLNNPAITFGLDLPNATDDIKNTVFSIIDTTNQAVMSQQIISLLVLGSFSYANTSLYSIGASNYYNVLTSSLSSWLSQISKDFDIGVRYTPEDNLTSEELEVALSTQIFDDKLSIEANLGMYTGSRNDVAGGASSIVGDLDMTYKITNRLSMKFYNHSNLNSNYYSYSYETYSDYTQGLGLSYSQSFDNIREIFARKNRNRKNKNNRK
ncbi:MAG: translocation/assembly module TamB domain-containing protein [Bacteroidales bacterium]|nr:translocation/assembly module TamB domain-containing protein [Bacteroidales bacterium]